jgi:ribonuclease P protein component
MLPRSYRLPPSEIPKVMRRGKRMAGEFIQLVMQKNEADVSRFVPRSGTPLVTPRFACIVSTKIDKRATRRNRMKRIIYESVRHLTPRIHGTSDYIFIAKNDFSGKPQAEVESMVAELLRKAGMFD